MYEVFIWTKRSDFQQIRARTHHRYKNNTRHRASTSTRWHIAFGLCCHSNESRAQIANLPNSAQLGGTPYHSSKLHPGPCSSVGMRRETGTQTDIQTRVTSSLYISRRLRLTRNVIKWRTETVFNLTIIFNRYKLQTVKETPSNPPWTRNGRPRVGWLVGI